VATKDALGLVGKTLDSLYRLDAVAGEGGFSTVYRGTHLGMGEPVAVKCLRLQVIQQPQGAAEAEGAFVRRFRDEGRIMYRLSQGNLDVARCITHSSAHHEETGILIPYMVLEWLDGHSVGADFRARRAQNLRGRSLKEVLAMFEPAAMALDYAHRQGVLHRDIKPGNLYLARRADGRVRMKVLDFGVAKVFDDTFGITMRATAAGFMAVSPRYAAPEQFSNNQGPVGAWTDVYSLALVMLEALRDNRVRQADGLAGCMVEALDPDAQPTARSLGIDVPPAVDQVLSRAVSIDSTKRPQSIVELWAELERGARDVVSGPAGSIEDSSATVPVDPSATVKDVPLPEPPPSGWPTLANTVVITDAPAAAPISELATTARPGAAKLPPTTLALSPQANPASARHVAPSVQTMPSVQTVPSVRVAPNAPTSVPSMRAAVETRPPAQPPRPRRTTLVVILLLLSAALGAGAVFAWYAWQRLGHG
jgi:serine/threonine protein kinase